MRALDNRDIFDPTQPAPAPVGLSRLPRDIVIPHIPKTAGTSLRETLRAALPDATHLYDYGPRGRITSPVIRRLRHSGGNRVAELRQLVPPQKPIVLMGHFNARTYTELFARDSFVTFLRDPIDRVISAYKHHVRHFGYHDSLLEFARNPQQRNKQSAVLAELSLQEIGFVGLSEQFAADLARLGELLGARLEPGHLNPAPPDQELAVDAGTRGALSELNELDLSLYESALRLRAMGGAHRPPEGALRGAARLLDDGTVQGWVVVDSGRRTVPLEILHRGRYYGTVLADRYRRDLVEKQVSATGIGGFVLDPSRFGITSGSIVFRHLDFSIAVEV